MTDLVAPELEGSVGVVERFDACEIRGHGANGFGSVLPPRMKLTVGIRPFAMS